jgi:hypothetical protein
LIKDIPIKSTSAIFQNGSPNAYDQLKIATKILKSISTLLLGLATHYNNKKFNILQKTKDNLQLPKDFFNSKHLKRVLKIKRN